MDEHDEGVAVLDQSYGGGTGGRPSPTAEITIKRISTELWIFDLDL
ncbi:MAG: hypothetical protein PHQ81_08110 [Methanofollis sp.]|nr:hypothetical protein [Methanofollis sp.]